MNLRAPMLPFAVGTVVSGLRSRSFFAVLALSVFLIWVAYLAAAFSPRQPKTVALDVGLSGMRFALVLFALFWINDLVGREVDRKTIFVWLTYPVSRGSYLLGRYCGITVLLALAVCVLGLGLWLATLIASPGYEQGHPVDLGWPYLATLAALWLDMAVVAAFGVLIAALSTVPMLPLVMGVAFALAGRTIGPVIDYLLVRGADGNKALAASYAPWVDGIRWVLPDLSRLDWRDWPMYGTAPGVGDVLGSLVMAFGYLVVCLSLAILALRRREFA